MFPFLLICLGLGIAAFAGLALFLWRIDACRHDDPARAAAADRLGVAPDDLVWFEYFNDWVLPPTIRTWRVAADIDLDGNPQTVGGSGAGILPAADLPDVPQPPSAAGIRPGSPVAILSDPAARLAAAALLGLRPDQVAWDTDIRIWHATEAALVEQAGGLADRALCRRGGV